MIRGGREEEGILETNMPTTINQVFEGLNNPYKLIIHITEVSIMIPI